MVYMSLKSGDKSNNKSVIIDGRKNMRLLANLTQLFELVLTFVPVLLYNQNANDENNFCSMYWVADDP